MKDTEATIKAALDPFGDPVEKGLLYAAAESRPPRYYAFTVRRSGVVLGNNRPHLERCSVSVHFFAPLAENTISRVKETKRALQSAGFTWPDSVDASDENGQHIVFECEALEDL